MPHTALVHRELRIDLGSPSGYASRKIVDVLESVGQGKSGGASTPNAMVTDKNIGLVRVSLVDEVGYGR